MNASDKKNDQALRVLYAEFDHEEQVLAELGLSQYAELLNEEDQTICWTCPECLSPFKEEWIPPIDECSDEVGG